MKSKTNKRKLQRGGAFSPQEKQLLLNNGFTQEQIDELEQRNIDFERITEKIDEIMNQSDIGFAGNSDELTDAVMNALNQDAIDLEEAIPANPDDVHDLDFGFNFDDEIIAGDDGPLNINDLNITPSDSESGHTTGSDDSFDGGKRRKRRTNKKRSNKRIQTNKKRTNKKRYNKGRQTNKKRYNKRRTNKKRYNKIGGKGMTDTITTEPYGYKEDEYDQQKNALNY